jgi:hypothetical protein
MLGSGHSLSSLLWRGLRDWLEWLQLLLGKRIHFRSILDRLRLLSGSGLEGAGPRGLNFMTLTQKSISSLAFISLLF